MSRSTLDVDDRLMDYIREVGVRESPVLEDLRETTGEMEAANMQISAEQGQLMRLLAKLMGVERAIEIGTFTGYSAICVAEAMPEDGQLVACDVDEDWTSVAREYWERAGVEDRVDLHLRPAVETIDTLLEAGEAGTFDFAFIDADKENYDAYYEGCLELLRGGGLIGIDNTLWSGRVADPDEQGESTRAIRAVNDKIADDERVDVSLVPIGDGLTLARKRGS
jgi:caffeoyl-CoA O-methyltransferase